MSKFVRIADRWINSDLVTDVHITHPVRQGPLIDELRDKYLVHYRMSNQSDRSYGAVILPFETLDDAQNEVLDFIEKANATA